MSISLQDAQLLYDQNRFLELFRQTAKYWQPTQRLGDLSVDELILGGRLATRLGGQRLSRWLFRAALTRSPEHPRVKYFTHGLRQRRRLFEDLRNWETNPEIEGADAVTQASWLAAQGVIWASARDFARAHANIARAKSMVTHESWVFSCESNVFAMEDKWHEALKSAEIAWEMNPGTPYAARSLGQSLVSLQRIGEAAERLSTAAEDSESFEVAQHACWHMCALTETLEGGERSRALEKAERFAELATQFAPLADRETRGWQARVRLDIAELKDDHSEMRRWADEVSSPFHRAVLENLRKNPKGLRIRMSFRHAIQKYNECLPTSVASALGAMGAAIDAEQMAAEITFGGTAEWRAVEWLEKQGFEVRLFIATPEIAKRLVRNRVAFVLMLESEASAHTVAVVGVDEGAGTLIIHDPGALRTTEYLMECIGRSEAPIGPRAMVAIPKEKATVLDELLPNDDVEAATARMTHYRALSTGGPGKARKIAKEFAERLPGHPSTKLIMAMQDMEDGRVGAALIQFQQLTNQFPGSAFVRRQLLAACRSLGDTALLRRTLASVVERGILPGIQSQQNWRHPPGAYVSEYADLLRESAETREQARGLLQGVIAREVGCAQAWHALGHLLSDEGDLESSVLAYRVAAGLQTSNEHYAWAYCEALGITGHLQEGLHWLEQRVRSFGKSPTAVSTWTTWINALEAWGQPQRALQVSEESLVKHGESPELLASVVPFLARMGHWDDAETLLGRLEKAGNAILFHEASTDFWQRRGKLQEALRHAESWVKESPLTTEARKQLLQLVAKREGTDAAVERAGRWLTEHPGHDDLEQIYSSYLRQASAPRYKRHSVLRRRVRRNREDGWAWREMASDCIADYEATDSMGQEKLSRRISWLVRESERTALESVGTIRLQARWCEARGKWAEAIERWMRSIEREPRSLCGYQQISECLARLTAEERKQHWEKLSNLLMSHSWRLEAARDTIQLIARWLGVAEAETAIRVWQIKRPNDPEIAEAYADLLLEQGHGRTDAQRALALLQPAAERFPYHTGLRFSLADAYRKLGQFEEAGHTLREIVRHHPANSLAQIQLARMDERYGRVEDALKRLTTAAERDPQNIEIYETQVRFLLGAGRHAEARTVLDEATKKFHRSVSWRERAIRLYAECGDRAAAVKAAREGVTEYPDGAYLWFLLARTLNEMRNFAGQGEVELCLRRSMQLNNGLFAAADSLAILLVEQRRYDDAEEVMRRIGEKLSDPSPALGRMAWVQRAKGEKLSARKQMAELLLQVPWYSWGWNIFMEWVAMDQAWEEARGVLGVIPAELKTNTQFRRQRLQVLEKAGLPAEKLDSEWNNLLRDFPEHLPLHLHRYDSLQANKRPVEAAAVLEAVRPLDPNSPYVLARFTEVLANDRSKADEAIATFLKIMVDECEESPWPLDYGWKALQKAGLDQRAYTSACEQLQQGRRPTPGAISLLAAYAMDRWSGKMVMQPAWRMRFPDRGAKEVLKLQKIIHSAGWPKEQYAGVLMKQLNDAGYVRLVIQQWRQSDSSVQRDVEAWSETSRALVTLNHKADATKLLEDWRERTGVSMWVVANYVHSSSGLGAKPLEKVRATCRDALAGLPHDHCAKYLVHRGAEACALLEDKAGLLAMWKEYRSYFNGKLERGEWFDTKLNYLLGDLLVMGRAAQGNDDALYRKMLRDLRWRRFTGRFQTAISSNTTLDLGKWWLLIWILLTILSAILQNP